MITSLRIEVLEESQVGEARRRAANLWQELDGDKEIGGRISVTVTEMAHNLVRHGGGGAIILRVLAAPPSPGLEIISIDSGPGIRNLAECMRDGFSGIGTAGNGLGSIQRLADRFEIFTQPEKGTVVWTQFGIEPKDPGKQDFEFGGISVALKGEEVCGDAWEVHRSAGAFRALVVDGLGHGPFAAEAAREAISTFRSNPSDGLSSIIESIHLALGKTRGAAGAIVELSAARKHILSIGVGNISMRLLNETGSKGLVCDNGTLGAGVRRIQEYRHPWSDHALLVMHSDGLSAQWTLDSYPGLWQRHPSVIAAVLFRDYRRERDDATVVVARYTS